MAVISDPLRSAKLKWQNAQTHLKTLQVKVAEFVDPEAYEIRQELHAKRMTFVLAFKEPLSDQLANISLVFGDVIQNYRATLDHISYGLGIAESGVEPPPDANRLSFPIGRTQAAFDNDAWHIKSLSARSKNFIRNHQSYRRPHDPDADFLPLLGELNDMDKHRLIHPTLLSPVGVTLRGRPIQDMRMWVDFRIGELNQETEIAHVEAPWMSANQQFVLEIPLNLSIANMDVWKGNCLALCAGIDRRVTRILGAAMYMITGVKHDLTPVAWKAQ